MRTVTYSMNVSLDGFIVGPDGSFEWRTASDPELFRFAIDEIRDVGVHLMGRRLYETMLYWETADLDPADDAMLEWAALWNPLPKVVCSRTLSAVRGNARLLSGGVAAEIERLKSEPAEGDIAIGGANLAAEAAAAGLIDEYRARVHPVLVGGGLSFHPRDERLVDLELVETRTFASGVVYLRHRVIR